MSKPNEGAEFSYAADDRESLSEAVVAAVAAVSGAEPAARGQSAGGEPLEPLHTVLDPEALDGLFRADAARTPGQVSFSYHGHEVTVHSDGHITVE